MTREELNKNKQKKITDELSRERRKKLVLIFIKLFLIVSTCFALFYLYNKFISTAKLVVKEVRIIDEDLPKSFDGLKIVHFSDLHYGSNIFIDEVKSLVKTINYRKPDIVVFTGDLIDKDYKITASEQEALTKQLGKINASLGKYAIMGDEDKKDYATIFNQSELLILDNSYDLIYKDSNEPILLVGNSSMLAKSINIEESYKYFNEQTANKSIYTISLIHEPDSVNEITSKYKTDLFLGGHSHNGNINIPYINRNPKIEGAKTFYKEFYQLDDSKLYISSGVGTNGTGIRILCQPSINFFRLSSK